MLRAVVSARRYPRTPLYTIRTGVPAQGVAAGGKLACDGRLDVGRTRPARWCRPRDHELNARVTSDRRGFFETPCMTTPATSTTAAALVAPSAIHQRRGRPGVPRSACRAGGPMSGSSRVVMAGSRHQFFGRDTSSAFGRSDSTRSRWPFTSASCTRRATDRLPPGDVQRVGFLLQSATLGVSPARRRERTDREIARFGCMAYCG